MAYETIHWDGGTVLFTTNDSGEVDDIKFGARAPLSIAGNITIANGTATVVYAQRDYSGSADTSIGTPPNPSRALCENAANAPIFTTGPDGITEGVNVFQGVRSYDPALGSWNSPDAYQGQVGDPMSQKSYMWDGNNSFAYSDPSGYFQFGGYWTSDQEQQFENAAAAADQQVIAAMKDYKKGSKEYKALAALHHDLQRGTAGWATARRNLSRDDLRVSWRALALCTATYRILT